ncbi:staphylopine uptake ABC transporter ATP-binding protein CntD [Paenibacillus sp. PL91]|uniref:staphylopine uptake ABC transporter ATP-binding protein CntD n=1 Tax=Paenibacillus sp. PL91 TaxID=2729538 RepID=UPI00145E2830|nr:ABC transporter ATP-binding protein [Paenibacillus sp. PL91]MBC9204024.1 ABC transporter ATP-binding protein [Paenibacillus sp. PL91]
MSILEVENLNVWDGETGRSIVRGSNFRLQKGQCLAIVGESGSGKSMTCKSIMRLNRDPIRQSGRISLKGEDISRLTEPEMRKKRGKNLCMIVQNGMTAFDPTCVIGVHMRETLHTHFGWNKTEVEETMKKTMESVMLQHPLDLMNKYPHQLSGGMLQRVMIALALALMPDVIIADEPTTALDAISQFEVMEQFMQLRERMGCSMLFVSHDLGVVKKIADEVIVMKDGEIVDQGSMGTVLAGGSHSYTQYLISSRLALGNNFYSIMEGEA